MGSKQGWAVACFSIFFACQISAALGIAAEEDLRALLVTYQKGELALESRGAPLDKILMEIERICAVKITGLEGREKEPINFSMRGVAIEEGMKQFLRYLGEKNYVFQFVDENLRFVSVFPEAAGDKVPVPDRMGSENSAETFSKVVRVVGIVEGSQAQRSGLAEGDLIIEYDGVRVVSTGQLIQEVEKKSQKERIEIVAVRDNALRRFDLEGGFIGVRIRTTEIPTEDLEYYLSGK